MQNVEVWLSPRRDLAPAASRRRSPAPAVRLTRPAPQPRRSNRRGVAPGRTSGARPPGRYVGACGHPNDCPALARAVAGLDRTRCRTLVCSRPRPAKPRRPSSTPRSHARLRNTRPLPAIEIIWTRAWRRRHMMRFLRLLRRRRSLEAMPDEIRAHLDEKVDALVASGMSRPDALREARRAFGHVGQIEEAGRDVWRMPALDEALADIAFGFRFLRRSPAFAAVAVLSLAIGIGANAAVFTVIDALLFRRLAALDPSSLVVFTKHDGDEANTLTFHEYDELRSRTSSFAGMLAYSGGAASLQLGATPAPGAGEPIHAGRVSSNFFDVLGVRMAVGRAFTPVNDVESDPERSVVLSYAYWQRRSEEHTSELQSPLH